MGTESKMRVVFCGRRPVWEKKTRGAWTLHVAAKAGGDPAGAAGLSPDGSLDAGAFVRWLESAPGFYALVAESDSHVVAAVDRVRSYPLYFVPGDDFCVGNDARLLRREKDIRDRDSDSILEFASAGYVCGDRTLYRGLSQLMAGEYLIWDKSLMRLETGRHYLFHHDQRPDRDEEELIRELDALHDSLFADIVERAAGRPIWVPLSGGWDSRLVASKLAQTRYPDVRTFSYGTPGNHESRLAAKVAARLGLPWFQVDVSRRRFRDFFWSDRRRRFFDLSDGLSVLPFVQDAHVLGWLLDSGRMPADAVVVNGQSGDFITGGHIRPGQFASNSGRADLAESLFEMHFNLWTPLRGEGNSRILLERISESLDELSRASGGASFDGYLAACWEWRERQSKFVVNGQRAYDFHGLDWEMPLWAPEYMDFWRGIPWGRLQDQGLYKNCLRRTGLNDVFNLVDTYVWRWPGASLAVVPVARAAGLLLGRRAKELVYDLGKFIGHYRYSYGAFSPWDCIRFSRRARSANSLIAMTWMRENMPGAMDGFFDEL